MYVCIYVGVFTCWHLLECKFQVSHTRDSSKLIYKVC